MVGFIAGPLEKKDIVVVSAIVLGGLFIAVIVKWLS